MLLSFTLIKCKIFMIAKMLNFTSQHVLDIINVERIEPRSLNFVRTLGFCSKLNNTRQYKFEFFPPSATFFHVTRLRCQCQNFDNLKEILFCFEFSQ